MKIYIAGPYTASSKADIEKNVRDAIDTGIAVLKKGHYPYIPHLTHYVDLRSKQINAGLKWEDYIEWDHIWLDFCDALLYLGQSRGANIELEYAKQSGKKIFYNLNEIPSVKRHKKMQFVRKSTD